MFIPNYPNFTVVEFDGLVFEEIKLRGDQIDNLFIEDLQLKYLPDDLFLFIPNLKWLDLRYVWRMPRKETNRKLFPTTLHLHLNRKIYFVYQE